MKAIAGAGACEPGRSDRAQHRRSHTLRIARKVKETLDAYSFELDVPAALADLFAYRPGQFVTFELPAEEGRSISRCYSLSSAPHEGRIKFTVKRVREGFASNYICDRWAEDSWVKVSLPGGNFVRKPGVRDILLIAAGSGVTPIISILKSVLESEQEEVVLFYANRDEASVIFAEELRGLAARYPSRLLQIHWLESVQGIPTVAALSTLLAPWDDREAFICGPAPFMDAAHAALISIGIVEERIYQERFSFDTDSPKRDLPESVGDSEDADTVLLSAHLDGKQHEFNWPRNVTLLDFLLKQGVRAPYSCRAGGCSACACRVTEGEVRMLRNDVLGQQDLDEGVVLACQAIPMSHRVAVTYE
jgi:3-ketosteroid 9alpha-monooxygenase subunit B